MACSGSHQAARWSPRSLRMGRRGMPNMSLAEKVAEHLPYLRRFARVVTGSQKSGDAYVAMTLEALLADPTILSPDIEPRVSLYRAFLRMLNSIKWNRQGDRDETDPAAL